MSDSSQGPGWWQASDGKWYSPETHPNYQATPNLPLPNDGPTLPPQTPTVPPAQSYPQYVDPAPVTPAKGKKPWWRRWWAIALGAIIVIIVIASVASSPEDVDDATAPTDGAPVQNTNDSSAPTTSDADSTDSSPTTSDRQEDADAPATTIVVTLPEPESNLTPSQQNALRSAESYLDFSGFSRQGLIDQLSSEFGDQFPVDDATVAVDSLDVDWNVEAVESAESYLDLSGFSRQGLIDQLSSEFGDKYTVEQATFAVDALNPDWNEEAAQSAQAYLDLSGFSCQGLIDQLSSEFGDQFTIQEATYGATQAGIC